jgi:hypothetical protein
MPNRGRTHSAGKPAGGIKGDIPLGEGAVGPGVEKGAGGAMPADVENSSGRTDPRFEPHIKTNMPFGKEHELDADAAGGRAGEPRDEDVD